MYHLVLFFYVNISLSQGIRFLQSFLHGISVCSTCYYLRRAAKVMFSSLLVCMLVCQLTTLRKTTWPVFHEIFRVDRTWNKEYSVTLMFRLTPWTHEILFNNFRGNPWLLVISRENEWTNFHEIFSNGCTCDREQYGRLFSCCNESLGYRMDVSILWICDFW